MLQVKFDLYFMFLASYSASCTRPSFPDSHPNILNMPIGLAIHNNHMVHTSDSYSALYFVVNRRMSVQMGRATFVLTQAAIKSVPKPTN